MLGALASRFEWKNRVGWATALLFFAFYTIVPNIPMWVAIPFLNLERRGMFCLEYLAAGAIALFIPRFLVAGLLFSLMSADVLHGVCQSYILSPGECLRNATSLWDLSRGRIFAVC